MGFLFQKRLQAKVDMPHFKLDLDTFPDPKVIEQLRHLMRELSYYNEPIDVKFEGLPFKLDYQISEEFKATNLVEFAKNAFTATESFRYKKATLPLNEIIDFGREKSIRRIEQDEVDQCLNKLFFRIESQKADFLAAHIIGKVGKDHMKIIADQIQKRAPHATMEIDNTNKDMMGKLVIELLFFGDFPYEFDEQTFD